MVENGFGGWAALLLLAVGVGYVLVIRHLSRRASRPRVLTDAEMLVALARMSPYSEYEIFGQAAREWHVPERLVDDHFKAYLVDGRIPHYVNAFTRKIGRKIGTVHQPPDSLDGGAPLPWL